MNIRQIALLPAMVVGAAMGAAALAGAVANADPSNAPVSPNDLSSWPMAQYGSVYGTDYTLSTVDSKSFPSIPFIYSGSQTTLNWQILDPDGSTAGSFDDTGIRQQYGQFLFAYVTNSDVVSNSEGTALPDGTSWDSTSFGLVISPVGPSVELFGTQSLSLTDGTTVDFFSFFGMANEVVTSDAGITDYMYFFGDDPILLFDIPASG